MGAGRLAGLWRRGGWIVGCRGGDGHVGETGGHGRVVRADETDRGDSKPPGRVCPLLEASWVGQGVLVTWSCPPRQVPHHHREASRGHCGHPEAGEWAPGVELHPAHHLPAVHVSESPQEWGCGPQPGPGSSSGRRPGPAGAPAVPQAWVPPSPFPAPVSPPGAGRPFWLFLPTPPCHTPSVLALQGFLTRRPHYLLQEVKSGPPAPDCLRVPGAGVCRAS